MIEEGPRLIGKEGVVDKDLAAAILAKEVGASTLLILTDVKKVQRGYGSFYPEDIDRMTVGEAQTLLKKGEFGAGSMGPKIEAAIGFVRGGGATAVIADLEDATDALRGEAGTVIVPSSDGNGAWSPRRSRRPEFAELLRDHEEGEETHGCLPAAPAGPEDRLEPSLDLGEQPSDQRRIDHADILSKPREPARTPYPARGIEGPGARFRCCMRHRSHARRGCRRTEWQSKRSVDKGSAS